MKNHISRFMLLSVCLLTFFASNSVICENSDSENKIRIGAIVPLSGALSSIGLGSKKGLDIAVSHINESGGIGGRPVEVVYEDSMSEPAKAVSAFSSLSNRSDILPITYVSLSSVTQALKAPSNAKGVFMMSDATLPGILDGSKYVIRRSFNVKAFVDSIIEHLTSKGIKNVSLIVAEEEWGSSYLNLLKSDPRISIAAYEEIAKDTSDVRSSLVRLNAKSKGKSDALLVVLVGSIQMTALNQIKQLGISLPLYSYILCSQDGISQNLNTVLDGIISFEAQSDITKDSYKKFEAAYRTSNTIPLPEASSLVAYDYLHLLKDAIENLGVDNLNAAKLKEFVLSKRKFDGVMGAYEFDEIGDSVVYTKAYEYRAKSCRLME